MKPGVPAEIQSQVAAAVAVIDRNLGASVLAIHLFGSAVDGGLQRFSDIDLLVSVDQAVDDAVRLPMMLQLLGVSAPPGRHAHLRALEVTVLARPDLVPWRYPARRELQFGEWLRADLAIGDVEAARHDHDLAILLTKAREASVALRGPPIATLYDPVPEADFHQAIEDSLGQWNDVPDWQDDERNIVLALARMWYSAAVGRITSKEAAADWLFARLPSEHRAVLSEARSGHLGLLQDRWGRHTEATKAFIGYARAAIVSEMKNADRDRGAC